MQCCVFDIELAYYLQWKNVDPDKIMNYKLKCVFEFPAKATQGNEEVVIFTFN